MARTRTVHRCGECGSASPRWTGRCPSCGAWNSLVSEVDRPRPVETLGRAGVNILAGVMGVTDVDPFIIGMTQAAGTFTPLKVAATAVLLAAASNNLIKGIYSFSLAGRKTGTQSLSLLLALAAAGLVPLLWL